MLNKILIKVSMQTKQCITYLDDVIEVFLSVGGWYGSVPFPWWFGNGVRKISFHLIIWSCCWTYLFSLGHYGWNLQHHFRNSPPPVGHRWPWMYWIIIIRNSEKMQCWHYLEAPAVLITYNRYKIHLEVGGGHFLERPPLPPETWGFSEIFCSSPSLFQHHRFLFTHIDYLCCYSLFTPLRKLQILLYCVGKNWPQISCH